MLVSLFYAAWYLLDLFRVQILGKYRRLPAQPTRATAAAERVTTHEM